LTRHAVIFEYKIGVLTLEHLMDTLYIKDYVNCVINGTNQKVRSNPSPARNLYKNIKCKLLRQPQIDQITLVMLSDRISKQADQYARKITAANKYVHRVSTGKNVPVKILLRTYKEYIVQLEQTYGIHWNHAKNLDSQIDNNSRIVLPGQFPKLDHNGKYIGYWKDQDLLDF